jgi:secreted trypsin-like serine protease
VKKSISIIALAMFSTLSFADVLIDDGIVAAKDSFPAVVKVSLFEAKNGKETLLGNCTGTMIADDVVVTAAHCVDTSYVTRVSLVGDQNGKSAKADGGIKVIKSYKSSSHETFSNFYFKGIKAYRTEEYQRLSAAEKEKFVDDIVKSSILMRGFDIGFLVLEKKQVFSVGKASKLGCKQSLSVKSQVTIAGYGRKSGKAPGVNYNEIAALNSGANTVVPNETQNLTYRLLKVSGKQVSNSGDSGGPMFKLGDQSVVFGVTSAGIPDRNNRTENVDYANLSSRIAKKVYEGILADKTVPASLASILKACK